MIEYEVDGMSASGYLARPDSGVGPGVLVLHSWWGLTPFFKGLCDRLAGEGFTALAPDRYGGPTAATVEEAEALQSTQDFERTGRIVTGAASYLREHPATAGGAIGVIGFSAGAAWAIHLSSLLPDEVAAVVAFYGTEGANFAAAKARFLGHYADPDEWEPIEGVQQMEADMRAAGMDVTFHFYPGAGHWFFEEDRPDAYDAAAAGLAWERTVTFLKNNLSRG